MHKYESNFLSAMSSDALKSPLFDEWSEHWTTNMAPLSDQSCLQRQVRVQTAAHDISPTFVRFRFKINISICYSNNISDVCFRESRIN